MCLEDVNMDINYLVEFATQSATFLQPAISTIVGALLSTLFVRNNTSTSEFEKIKAGKFEEAIDLLLKSGKMSYCEYFKCHNFLKIAKRIDRENVNADYFNEFDFDWFVRFFDSVGNISNEKMQDLWSKVLAGEINNQGSFSLRTLETLRNMTQREATLFESMSHLVLTEKNGLKFILCMSDDLGKDINEQYGFFKKEFVLLEECGILSSIRNDNRIRLEESLNGIWNNSIIITLNYKRADCVINSYKYSSYTLTQTGCQLLNIINGVSDEKYLLDIGKELSQKYSGNLLVRAHRITKFDNDVPIYDQQMNLLDI